MDRGELVLKLNELNVSSSYYSLFGDLLPDRIILYNSYNDWIVFYLDERGNRNDEKIFKSESEACIHTYEEFKELIKFRKK